MSFANPSTAPTPLAGALWSPTLYETGAFGLPAPDVRTSDLIDVSAFSAVQIDVRHDRNLQITLQWQTGMQTPADEHPEVFELGQNGAAVEFVSFRVPVRGAAVILTATTIAGGVGVVCDVALRGTNAPGIGCAQSNQIRGGLIGSFLSNVGAGASAVNELPFHYGPVALTIVNRLVDQFAVLEAESILMGGTWQAVLSVTGVHPSVSGWMPARRCRLRRGNATAAPANLEAAVTGFATLGGAS